MAENEASDYEAKRIKELLGSMTDDNEMEILAEIKQLDPDFFEGKYKGGGYIRKRKTGSPPTGEIVNKAVKGQMAGSVSRGAGAATKGIKFKGVR